MQAVLRMQGAQNGLAGRSARNGREVGIAFSIGIQRSRHEPMFTRRQILRLRDVVVEKCNEVTYGIRAVDTIPADDVIFIRPM